MGWDYFVFAILTGISLAAIAYLANGWFATDDWFNFPLVFCGVTLLFFGRLFVQQLRWWTLPFMRLPCRANAPPKLRVGVATTFVPGAETVEMLKATVQALVAMDFPHETWVLDEGSLEEIAELCGRHGALYFSRKDKAEYQTTTGQFAARTKHGNYNSWLDEIGFGRYDVIVTFDPDHVPDSSYLTEVLGYFNDPKIGYVQTAQAYYNGNASFIARGAAEETFSYYSSTQMFCYAMGYPIVTGCHTAHRTEALKAVGGLAAHDADDLLITLYYRAAGWEGVYVPKILARGLVPVDWEAYLAQQLRWARSVLDIKLRIHPRLAGKLSYRELIASFFHGFYYLQGLTTAVGALALAYMLASGRIPEGFYFLLSLPAIGSLLLLAGCDLYRQRFFLDPKKERGFLWRTALLQQAKWPYLLLALYQVFFRSGIPYSVTRKSGEPVAKRQFRLFFPHIATVVLIGIAAILGLVSGNLQSRVLLFVWALSTLAALGLAATAFLKFPAPCDPAMVPLVPGRAQVRARAASSDSVV